MNTESTNPSPEQPTPRTDALRLKDGQSLNWNEVIEDRKKLFDSHEQLERELAEAQVNYDRLKLQCLAEAKANHDAQEELLTFKQPIADEEVRKAVEQFEHQLTHSERQLLKYTVVETEAAQTLLRRVRQSEGMREEINSLTVRLQTECDHDWKIRDNSFSHEYGTEIIVLDECQKCGMTKPRERDDE
jgi:hypothetical protein